MCLNLLFNYFSIVLAGLSRSRTAWVMDWMGSGGTARANVSIGVRIEALVFPCIGAIGRASDT